MNLITGKTYLIRHASRGALVTTISDQDDEWTKGLIIDAKPEAILGHDTKFTDDEATLKTSLITGSILIHENNEGDE